jgi:FkbM family methyltransferase
VGYAKDSEDIWLLEQFPEGYKGYAVELGAVDGTYISCTKLLEERGWEVLCIEPNPFHQKELRAARKLVLQCACDNAPRVSAMMWENAQVLGRTLTGFSDAGPHHDIQFNATVLTLDQCLMVVGFPSLDVLVLDVDGVERRIIDGFDIDRWKPKAVIIEGDASGRLDPFLERGYKQVGVRMDDNRLLLRGEPCE